MRLTRREFVALPSTALGAAQQTTFQADPEIKRLLETAGKRVETAGLVKELLEMGR